MKNQFKIGNSVVIFEIVDVPGSSAKGIPNELIRDSGEPCIYVIDTITIGDGDSRSEVIKEFCEKFKNYPVLLQSSEDILERAKETIIAKGLGMFDLGMMYPDETREYFLSPYSKELYRKLCIAVAGVYVREALMDPEDMKILVKNIGNVSAKAESVDMLSSAFNNLEALNAF